MTETDCSIMDQVPIQEGEVGPRQGALRTKRIREKRVMRRVREKMPARASFCLRGTRDLRARETGMIVTRRGVGGLAGIECERETAVQGLVQLRERCVVLSFGCSEQLNPYLRCGPCTIGKDNCRRR